MLNWKEILSEGVELIRNYRTTYRKRKGEIESKKIGRVWLEKQILRYAKLTKGQGIIIKYGEKHIYVRVAKPYEVSTHVLHSKKDDPILDLCNSDVHRILGVGIKVDIIVKNQELYIIKEETFRMAPENVEDFLQANDKEKFKIISLFAGGGGMTSAVVNTNAAESVFAIELDEPHKNPYNSEIKGRKPSHIGYTIETLKHNFPDTTVYWGDIRSVHNRYIPKADIALISPPCVEYSALGKKEGGILEHFTFHIARIVLQSGVSALLFENVPEYYQSRSFKTLKRMLSPIFTEWHEASINPYDIGSVNLRDRRYAVAFREETSFEFPESNKTPESKRKTISDYIDLTNRNWRTKKEASMAYYLSEERNKKYAHTGFTMKNSKLFLQKPTDKKVACITKGYMRVQPHQTYLQHPTDELLWDKFTPEECKNLLEYPSWFSFPEGISDTNKYQILGNSINCLPIEIIASRMIESLMEIAIKKAAGIKNIVKECIEDITYKIGTGGQLALF